MVAVVFDKEADDELGVVDIILVVAIELAAVGMLLLFEFVMALELAFELSLPRHNEVAAANEVSLLLLLLLLLPSDDELSDDDEGDEDEAE